MNSGSGYAMKVDTLANGAQVKLGVPSNSNRHSWQWIGQQLNLWNTSEYTSNSILATRQRQL